MRLRTALLIAATSVLFVGTARAALYFGWADEFLGGRVDCNLTSGSPACAATTAWSGTGTGEPPTWDYVGGQGATATGRANAREKIMFRFREASTTSCFTITANLSRARTTSPPAPGSSCSAVAVTFVGSVSQTFDSCGFAPADTYNNMRLLPVFNFSGETAGSGTTVGYRTTTTETDNIGGGSGSSFGCYRIAWM